MSGQITKHIRAKTAIRIRLGGIPYMKNSPLVNCLESYAMALGAAPTNRTNGMPAVASDANMTTSGATDRYLAVTRATGSEMAMAATFMMKLVMISTKKATPSTKTNQWAFLKQGQPVDRHPFGRSGLPETVPDAHRSGKKKHDVPGYQFQVVNVQDFQDKEEYRGNEKDSRLVQGPQRWNHDL